MSLVFSLNSVQNWLMETPRWKEAMRVDNGQRGEGGSASLRLLVLLPLFPLPRFDGCSMSRLTASRLPPALCPEAADLRPRTQSALAAGATELLTPHPSQASRAGSSGGRT